MVRVVFNPVVFRLKRWPQPTALAVATVAVFLTTWLLHAYQCTGSRGPGASASPTPCSGAVLGVLVLVNVQLDARRAATRSRAPRQDEASTLLAIASRPPGPAGTFAHDHAALVALVRARACTPGWTLSDNAE